jgi:3-isopropylmalate/(R)-2-methylmalate dehydratase large subunit
VQGRPYAPSGAEWDRALAQWRELPSDADAAFDAEIDLDCAMLAPQITWGTGMDQVAPVDGVIPDPATATDSQRRKAWREALDYMGLRPGERLAGTRIDRVFIGSCTNARLSDLRAAAAVARGRKVAAHVRAWVVPGSMAIKRDAEAEGLHRTFLEAGFEWREPGCSMCLGANEEVVAPQARCVSTSNRNFVGRQGPQSRTHIASPVMAAAAAIAGEITDVRRWLAT